MLAENPINLAVPLVSVVLVTRNRPTFLQAAVDSVRAQTYPRVELVIVDNGSDPETARLLESLKAIARIHRLDPPDSVSAARLAGAANTSGRYVNFLDDDDVLAPEKLARQVPFAEARGANVVTFTDGWLCDPQLRPVARFSDLRRFDPGDPGRALGLENILLVHAPLIPTELLRDMSVDPELCSRSAGSIRCWGEEWDLWLQLSRRVQFAYLPEALVSYRRHASNATALTPLLADAGEFCAIRAYAHVLQKYGLSQSSGEVRKRLERLHALLGNTRELRWDNALLWGLARLPYAARVRLVEWRSRLWPDRFDRAMRKAAIKNES